MIAGLKFSLLTTTLRRNYRNPFTAYAGSLGLLFRWFTASGPKILPNDKELKNAFGFAEVFNETPDRLLLRSRNDAHPANNWSHVLSSFPTATAAYQQLAEFPLRKEQVLWIRFTPEENGFNYESLQRWSYHSVHSLDAPDLLDKYVKGQEFPVVVIEGIPKMFSWGAAALAHPSDLAKARIEMWQARRLVYLTASRTNVFLYFILPPDTAADVADEFKLMFSQLGQHLEQASPSGTFWELRVSKQGEVESLDDYLDAIEAESVDETASTEAVAVPVTSDKITKTTSVDDALRPSVALPIAEPVVASAASAKDAKTSVMDHGLPPAVSLPIADTAPPIPEEIKPAKVSVVAQRTPPPNVPQVVVAAAQTPQAPAAINSRPEPPHPAVLAAPNLLKVTVSNLAADFRMSVSEVINILELHNFKGLTDKSPVVREVASQILRRALITTSKRSFSFQPKTVSLNPLADQLDAKFNIANGAPNISKQKSKP